VGKEMMRERRKKPNREQHEGVFSFMLLPI